MCMGRGYWHHGGGHGLIIDMGSALLSRILLRLSDLFLGTGFSMHGASSAKWLLEGEGTYGQTGVERTGFNLHNWVTVENRHFGITSWRWSWSGQSVLLLAGGFEPLQCYCTCAGGIVKQEKYFAFSYLWNRKESGGEATPSSKGQGGVWPSEMGSCTCPFVLWESIMLWMHISSSFCFGWPMSGCHCGHLEWAALVLVCIVWSCTTARFCLS